MRERSEPAPGALRRSGEKMRLGRAMSCMEPKQRCVTTFVPAARAAKVLRASAQALFYLSPPRLLSFVGKCMSPRHSY